MDEMFCNCSNLKTINFNKIDTSDVTDISAAFARCDHLESIDFNNFDTSKVTRMEKIFAGYVLFTKPDVETKDIVDGELVFIYYYKKYQVA